MATRPLSPCLTPGCRELVTRGRCAECTSRRRQQQDARRPDRERYNSTGWRRNRGRFLAAHPTCSCGAPATEADHYPRTRAELLEAGVADPDAWRYLVARCKPCHSRRTLAHLLGRSMP